MRRFAARIAARAILPPLAMYLLARWRLDRSAIYAGENPFSFPPWSRWDSAHYLSIASGGYEFFSCARMPGYQPDWWCGNTGWLPTLPFLIRALGFFGVEPIPAGVIIAQSCALLGLILFWNLLLQRELTIRSFAALALAAFFPGHVYQHALFPVSLVALFHILAIHAYTERRFAWAGIFGALGAFTYSSGVFLAAVFGLHLLLTEREKPLLQQARQMLLAPVVTAAGFAAFHVFLWATVGVWDAYFKVQGKYKFAPTWPWETLSKHVYRLGSWSPQSVQTVYVAMLAVVLLWAAAKTPRRVSDEVLGLFLIVYWLLPLALGGDLSLYRAEAVLLPAAALARKLPLPIAAPVLLGAIYISAKMAVLFFKNVLV